MIVLAVEIAITECIEEGVPTTYTVFFDHCSRTYRMFTTAASQEAVVLQGIKDGNDRPDAIHYLEGSHGRNQRLRKLSER